MEYYVSLKNCMVSPRVVTVLVWRLSSYDPHVINDDTLYITQEQPLQSHEGFLFIASQSVATFYRFLGYDTCRSQDYLIYDFAEKH